MLWIEFDYVSEMILQGAPAVGTVRKTLSLDFHCIAPDTYSVL
jgi:hypothetical protein